MLSQKLRRWLILLLSSGSSFAFLSKLLWIKTVDTERQLCLQKCSFFERMPLLLDQHLSQNMPAIKLYWSKVPHQVNMLLSAVKKYHLQASGLLILPMYLDDATVSFSLMPSTQTFIEKSRDCI